MSEIGEIRKQLRKESQQEGQENRQRAAGEFEAALRLATQHGFKLIRRTDIHYTLIHGTHLQWRTQIYPGNHRIWNDPACRCPFLKVPLDWTLVDIVNAAILLKAKESGVTHATER